MAKSKQNNTITPDENLENEIPGANPVPLGEDPRVGNAVIPDTTPSTVPQAIEKPIAKGDISVFNKDSKARRFSDIFRNLSQEECAKIHALFQGDLDKKPATRIHLMFIALEAYAEQTGRAQF